VHKLDLPAKTPIQPPRLTPPRTGRITPKNSEVIVSSLCPSAFREGCWTTERPFADGRICGEIVFVHPTRSVLEHLLGAETTIPSDRGLFLDLTWRMHPDVCGFVSEIVYDGRLKPAPGRERQSLEGVGAGIRYMPVEHEGRSQASPEEAQRVGVEIERLVGRNYTDAEDQTRPLGHADILVVAPYNSQVRTLRAALPDTVRVGTVDKFQGQEAPVVFYSTASSSGADLPRHLEFLFSRNRLNVAISRAQCLAIVVGSPRLLEVRCRTVEQMRMVTLCVA
jgi:superfamily I DNA and/or RNA helicase